jgi:hypothetical protein
MYDRLIPLMSAILLPCRRNRTSSWVIGSISRHIVRHGGGIVPIHLTANSDHNDGNRYSFATVNFQMSVMVGLLILLVGAEGFED